jgi:hypothetical protein
LRRIIYLIRFGLMPEQSDSLPVDMDEWLLPVWLTLKHIEQ